MTDEEKILERIVSVVRRSAPGSEVYLYGSRARGDHRHISDWDLLILLQEEKDSFSLQTKLIDDLFYVEIETGAVISPLIYTKKEWEGDHYDTPLFRTIRKEGIRIQ